MRKLLVVTAHPDDEAGAFGGILALSADRGIETYVTCLTAGTAARNRGNAQSSEELAALRTQEFAASCKLLGVRHFEVLRELDGKLAEADLYRVTGELVRRIRQFRPQVMLTFGPDGGLTGHFDHAMAGTFATLAFEWAGRPQRYPEQLEQGLPIHRVQKLYYHTADYKLDDFPLSSPATVTARIDVGADRHERKIQAFMQHTTQAPLFDRIKKNIGSRPPVEMFHLAATCQPQEACIETDLFAGVVED